MRKLKINIFFILVVSIVTSMHFSCKEDENPIENEDLLEEEQEKEKPKVSDIDGNEYTIDLIAGREWMVENLKTSKYNDGIPIPNVTGDKEWSELNSGAFAWYNNDPKNEEKLGKLYNWYAVTCCPICPKGWRIPTKEEFEVVLKHYGNRFWYFDGARGENFIQWSDFNSMGAERRRKDGIFHKVLNYESNQNLVFTGFWSSDSYNAEESFIVYIAAPGNRLISAKPELSIQPKKTGISVKCIKEI
jgi:uncharacterized protein (TIGR02145 family)